MDDRLDATLPSVPVPPGAGASERPARDRVGPYRVQTVLGRGGMGVVYGALDERGARVAVKTMRAGVVRAAAVARFAREASLRIEHENVVRVLDAGVDPDGTPYIAFEWLEGEAFAQRLARARPSEADARDVVAQACAGLAVVHAAGIVHRDLKPANLFCCSDGVVKVLDFGVARVAEAATLTSEGAVLGTLSYLSPEQAQSRRDVDARTDVWALGVVLYEALSGVLPFDRESPVGTLLAIVEDPPRPLRELAPEVSAHVADVVHACLAKRPDERLSSVSALAAALDDAARGRAVAIPPPAAADAPVPPPAIRAGEQRIVAALLARGVRDMALVGHEVGARGGRLVALLGGAAIGVFGAGSWDGEEAARAVSAAVACRHACERVAVASGWARATERGIAGGAVETAEHGCARRLAGVAVDVHTARALGDRFAIEASSDGWHEVLAERPAGWLARHAAPVAELVGRRRELDALSRELREVVVSGAARGVVLVGPTGIGKSAIRRVLELHAPDAGATFVLTGRGEQASRDVSLSLFLSALRRRATRLATAYGAPRLDVRAPPMERLAAVRGLVREAVQDPTRAREMTEILAERMALDAPGGVRDADGSRLGQLAADRAHLAMLDYVAGLARRGPTTLLLEDLQWADPASLALVAELLHHLRDAPLFVFATARAWPEALGSGEATGPTGNVARWELGGLAPDAVRELATRVAGCAPSDAVMAALVARTEGNPLFVEQITLELAERGALRTNDPLAIALPLTVEAALQSRLDLLPDRERELVKRLSVYGRPVTIDDLVAVGVAEPAPGLGSLVAQRVLRAGGPGHGAGATYHVLSPLVAEAAYRMNAPELLVALHHAAADRLAGHGADPEEIAVHRERAGQAQEASRAYVQAALAASARGDSLRALRCSDRALALGDPGELAFALRMARADALRFLGRATDQERELAAASAVARDDVMRARVLTEEVVRLARAGRRDDARRVADGAVEAARRSGDRAVLALALARRAEMLIFAGGPGEAEEALAEAEQLAPHAGLETRALVCAFRARLANVRGDLGGARASFERAVALYRELGDVRRGASAEANLADAYNRVGAYDAASVALAHALDGCRRIGNRLMEGYALANLAHARTMQGRPDEALRRLEEADAVLALAHDARLALAVTVYRARAWLALGRSEEAATAADSAASDAIRLKLPSLAALALTVGARAFVRSGDTRRALDRSGRALALRDTLGGAEDDEGEVYLAHVDALCAAGQHKLAAEVRERAKARLEEIAGRIADPDWRLRFLRDVPAHRALMDEASRA